jgi:hypothetical protein
MLTDIKEQANNLCKTDLELCIEDAASMNAPATPPMKHLSKQSYGTIKKQRCTQSYGLMWEEEYQAPSMKNGIQRMHPTLKTPHGKPTSMQKQCGKPFYPMDESISHKPPMPPSPLDLLQTSLDH